MEEIRKLSPYKQKIKKRVHEVPLEHLTDDAALTEVRGLLAKYGKETSYKKLRDGLNNSCINNDKESSEGSILGHSVAPSENPPNPSPSKPPTEKQKPRKNAKKAKRKLPNEPKSQCRNFQSQNALNQKPFWNTQTYLRKQISYCMMKHDWHNMTRLLITMCDGPKTIESYLKTACLINCKNNPTAIKYELLDVLMKEVFSCHNEHERKTLIDSLKVDSEAVEDTKNEIDEDETELFVT